MSFIWWQWASIEVLACCLTAMTTHLVMSLGQTVFHRYLGHRRIGGKFAADHVHFHHGFYADDHVVSENYQDQERNNTPFFLVPVILVISLSYLFLPLDLFIIQLTAMSISFYAHIYIDLQYHVTDSWLGRYSWFRRKQQLHFVHHQRADCNFAAIDYFWDRLLGTYRSAEASRQTAPGEFLTPMEIGAGGREAPPPLAN